MATPFEDTPKWFNANHYLDQKAVQMQAADPAGNWTREKVISDFAAHGIDNPYDHYKAYGDVENLTPTPLFNNTEYLAAKAAMMGSTWTVEMVAKAIHDAGLTLMEHYIQYGGKYENLSPSSDFNQDKYYDAKLQEHIAAEPDKGWTLDMVKADFAAAGITPLEHFLTYGAVEGLVDKYDFSVNGTPIPHPGNTKIVLTKGADIVTPDATVAELKTSDRDDTIHAVAGSSTTGTLNIGDVIDGGAGMDTLMVDMQQTFNGFTKGSMKGVEQVVLQNASNVTFKAVNVSGVQNYVVDGSEKGGVTIENVESANVNYSLKMEKGDFIAKINDAALSGKTDDVNVILNGVGLETAASKITVKGMNAGVVEGLTLDVQGKDNFVTVGEKHKTIAVDGTGNLTVAAAAGLESFDASDATGKISADLSASTTLKTVIGGSADDTLTVGSLITSAMVDGGEGNDALKITGLGSGSNVNSTITDVENVAVTAFATGTATFNLSKVTGLDTFTIESAGTAASVFSLVKGDLSELNVEVTNAGVSGGALAYDGTGSLNVAHTGGSTGGNTTLSTLTAGKVTELTIANNAEKGEFTVSNLEINSVDILTLDTGDQDKLTVSGGATAKLAALDSVFLKGESDAVLSLGTGVASNLTSVDASELLGKLDLDLHSLTGVKGVTVTMGDYGTGTTGIRGSVGADTFILGTGKDVVNYGAIAEFAQPDTVAPAADALEHIVDFQSGTDLIQFAHALAGSTANTGSAVADIYSEMATSGVTVAAGKVNGFEVTFSSGKHGYVAADVAGVLGSVSGFASTGSDKIAILAVSDTSDTYLWYYAEGASTDGEISANELKLIGVIDGVTEFVAGDFGLNAIS